MMPSIMTLLKKRLFFEELVKKVDAIDTSNLVKTDYDKIISEIEGKLTNIARLDPTTILAAVEE